MSRASLLQETALWMDTVNLALCLFIYEVCNDCQFEFASGSDFVNFMNLKPTSRPVTVRPKENLRVCYMVFSVSQAIRPRERGRLWAEGFLKHCGISKSYYDKHRSDVCGKGATEENRNFRKAIDKAIENARRLNNPIAARRFPIRQNIFSLYPCAIPLTHNGMAHFLFVHFPHLFPIGPLRVKLNFALETEENYRLTNSRFRFPNGTSNNYKTNEYGK